MSSMNCDNLLYYLGSCSTQFIEKSSNDKFHQSLDNYRCNEEKIIDQVENAQLEGLLLDNKTNATKLRVDISRHGVKLIDPLTECVIDRVPLVSIVLSVAYDNGQAKFNTVLIEQMRNCERQRCLLFQSDTQKEADQLCHSINYFFRAATDAAHKHESIE